MTPIPFPSGQKPYVVRIAAVIDNGADVSGASFLLYNITKDTKITKTSNESDSNIAIPLAGVGDWDVGDTIWITATYSGKQITDYHYIQSSDNGSRDFGTLVLGAAPAAGFNAHIEQYGESMQLWGSYSDTDDLGNPVKTWAVDKGTFTGVVLRPTAADITISAGRLSSTDKKLLAPTTADIATGDRIEIDDITYDLLGSHEDWQMKLSGTTYHQQLFLRRVL